MIAYTDLAPDTGVASAEYVRLLCYPRGWILEGRALELAERAGAWYAEHGRPWVFVRETEGGVLAVVSAGPEVDSQVQRLWQEEKPDEYFFLHAYAAAVVEHLTSGVRMRLEQVGRFRYGVAPRGLLTQAELPGALEVLDSGMLRPKFSQAVLFRPALAGVEGVVCNSCGLSGCDFRRRDE
jgi:hypothetical protein